MKSQKLLHALLLIGFIATSCASVTTVQLANSKAARSYASVPNEQVVIYRKTKLNPMDFEEIGMTTVRGSSPQIDKVYEYVRDEAGKQGAQYVTDFAMKVEEVTYPVSNTSCDGKGNCHTTTTTATRLDYTASGTLLRRKK